MSMNLKCNEIDLWQTPTYITYMCYSNGDGGWKGILYRYKQWVRSHSNGVWGDGDNCDGSQEDWEIIKNNIKHHIAEIENVISISKKLTFSVI